MVVIKRQSHAAYMMETYPRQFGRLAPQRLTACDKCTECADGRLWAVGLPHKQANGWLCDCCGFEKIDLASYREHTSHWKRG